MKRALRKFDFPGMEEPEVTGTPAPWCAQASVLPGTWWVYADRRNSSIEVVSVDPPRVVFRIYNAEAVSVLAHSGIDYFLDNFIPVHRVLEKEISLANIGEFWLDSMCSGAVAYIKDVSADIVQGSSRRMVTYVYIGSPQGASIVSTWSFVEAFLERFSRCKLVPHDGKEG